MARDKDGQARLKRVLKIANGDLNKIRPAIEEALEDPPRLELARVLYLRNVLLIRAKKAIKAQKARDDIVLERDMEDFYRDLNEIDLEWHENLHKYGEEEADKIRKKQSAEVERKWKYTSRNPARKTKPNPQLQLDLQIR